MRLARLRSARHLELSDGEFSGSDVGSYDSNAMSDFLPSDEPNRSVEALFSATVSCEQRCTPLLGTCHSMVPWDFHLRMEELARDGCFPISTLSQRGAPGCGIPEGEIACPPLVWDAMRYGYVGFHLPPPLGCRWQSVGRLTRLRLLGG